MADTKSSVADLIKSILQPSDVMSPAARAQYKKDTGEDVLLGAPSQTETVSPTTSATLEVMNAIVEKEKAAALAKEQSDRSALLEGKYKRKTMLEELVAKGGAAIAKEVNLGKQITPAYITELFDAVAQARKPSPTKPKETK